MKPPIDRKLFAFRRNERSCATISFEIVLVNVWSILMNQSGNNSVFIINSVKTEPACLRLIYFSTWYKLWNRMSTCYRSMLWRHVIEVNTTVIWLWDPFVMLTSSKIASFRQFHMQYKKRVPLFSMQTKWFACRLCKLQSFARCGRFSPIHLGCM